MNDRHSVDVPHADPSAPVLTPWTETEELGCQIAVDRPAKPLAFWPPHTYLFYNSSMMELLLLIGFLASSVAILIIIVWRGRRVLHSYRSNDRLGSVSEHWLTTHRAER